MSTVTIKGQATIPKHIREFLQIQPGKSDVEFILENDVVTLVNRSTHNPFNDVVGITKEKMTTDEIMALTRD